MGGSIPPDSTGAPYGLIIAMPSALAILDWPSGKAADSESAIRGSNPWSRTARY